MSDKDLLNASGCILSSFETLHYLQELSHTNVFKHRARKNLSRTLDDLKEIELKYYDKVDEVDEKEIQAKKTENNLAFIEWMLKSFDSSKVQKLKEVCISFDLDEKRLTSISDKIHLNNGAKRI